MGEDQRDEFEKFLTRKQLSEITKREYLLFYDKIQEIMIETGQPLNQLIVDAFLDVYPHLVARACLRNLLEMLRRNDLTILRKTGRTLKKEQITISREDREKLRMALYDHDERYGLIFDLTNVCALRRQEVLNIKAGDIDISNGESMFILIRMGKGNKERKVFVQNDIAVLVMHYLENHPMKLSNYLFESKVREGYPMDYTNWNKAFSKASQKVLGKKYHPHQLRGTRATEWYDQGVDITRIQQRLGHSDISTTMIYIKPDARKELERWSKE